MRFEHGFVLFLFLKKKFGVQFCFSCLKKGK